MENQLLTAKLRIPSTPAGLVSRPRLLQQLNEGLSRRLILISAAPGSGKTSLLSEWLHSQSTKSVWIALDDDDNDPALFFIYLVAAIQKAVPALNINIPKQSDALVAQPIEKSIPFLINELEKLSEPLILVLDDYHVINEATIHRVMSILLDHQPPGLHIVIATRVDPPLPVALMRARGYLVEIRAQDLRFTHPEISQFLKQTFHLELTEADIDALEKRTEGWVAGLQLAAVSLQGRKDPGAFIRAFTGSNRFVLDYLMEEVLQRQPAPIQTFLLQTSILESLCAPLCSTVTGMLDAQSILENLERSNLFIIPLDDQRQWYRYHHLFADLLRQRLSQFQPDHSDLNDRASLWLEQNHFIAEAIDHAMAAGNFKRAAALLTRHAESYILKDQVITLKRWLELFPRDQLFEYPEVCLYCIWVLIFNGNIVEAHPLLDTLEKMAAADAGLSETLIEEMKSTRAFLYMYQSQFQMAIELAQEAYTRLPATKVLVRGVTAWLISFIAQLDNSTPEFLPRMMEESIFFNPTRNNILLINLSTFSVGMIHIMHGQLNEAIRVFQTGISSLGETVDDYLSVESNVLSPSTALILHGLGEVLRERNDLEKARTYLTKAIDITCAWGNGEFLADMYVCMAKINLSLGDQKSTEVAFEKGLHLRTENKITLLTVFQLEAWQAWFWAATGHAEKVETWLASVQRNADSFSVEAENAYILSYWNALVAIIAGRLLLIKGDYPQVIARSPGCAAQAADAGWMEFAYQLNLQLVSAYASLGDDKQAFQRLERVLKLAEPEGFMRTFLDEGSKIQGVLLKYDRVCHPQGKLGAYVHRLLAAFEGQMPSQTVAGALPEPLSERELQVLAFLAAGLSNRDISQRIVTAISTVKSHTNAIYRKLGVSTRTQAIARARELNLL